MGTFLGIVVRLIINAATSTSGKRVLTYAGSKVMQYATRQFIEAVKNGSAGRKTTIRVK